MKRTIVPGILLLSSLNTQAIDIVVSYDGDHDNATVHELDDGSDPAFPNPGDKLLLIANAAADYWEDIIKDPGTLTLAFHYEALSAPNIGHWTQGDTTFVPHPTLITAPIEGRNCSGEIEIHDTREWFYDLTPADHSEYVFTSTTISNLDGAPRANFNGAPPASLEAYYVGTPAPGAPALATTNIDLYSVVLHEIGHALGLTTQLDAADLETADGQFNFDPVHLNGAVCGLNTNPVRALHPLCPDCLMSAGIGPGKRRLPSATDVLALAICPLPNYSQIDIPRKDFLPGGTSSWHLAGNWVGKRLPDSEDDTFVRNSNPGGIFGVTPFPVDLAGSVLVENVTVSDYSVVSTGPNRLKASTSVNILHDGGTFDSPAIEIDLGGELETRDATLQGGTLRLRGGLLDIDRSLDLAILGARRSALRGFGTVDVAAVVPGPIRLTGKLVNSGSIVALDDSTLTLQSTGDQVWDLDGDSEDGALLAAEGDIAITGGTLTDDFGGSMIIKDGHSITIAEDWTMNGSDAELEFDGGLSTATLGGTGALDLVRGTIDANGDGSILCPLILREDAAVDIAGGAVFTFGGATELHGGTYTGNGTLRFNNALTVAADTTIEVGSLDLDGLSGNTVITLDESLTLNTTQLDAGNSRFDGTINLNSVFSSLNVNGPASWQMDGIMNVTGSTASQFPMITGTTMELSGTATVSNHSTWTARTIISGEVQMSSNTTDRLVLRGGPQGTPNRLADGIVGDFGTLELTNDAWLHGAGLLPSVLVRADSGLLAENGTLTVREDLALASTSVLGTADSSAILQIGRAWTLPAGAELSLSGGSVRGGALDNLSLISGNGTLATDGLVNSGEIRATGDGTLVIDPGSIPDLDGAGSGRLSANEGDLTVLEVVTDPFGGIAEVGPDRTLTFAAGWTLDEGGTLSLTGNDSPSEMPARLVGPSNVLRGTVEVSGPAELAISRLGATANVDLASGAVMRMARSVTLEAGASFSDGGGAAFITRFLLTLENGSSLNAPSVLTGDIRLGAGNSVASATLHSPDFQNATTLEIDIADGAHDQLLVSGALRLDGTLDLAFTAPNLAPGDTWEIIAGTSLSGRFDNVLHSGLPAGVEPRIFTVPTGVYVKLVQSETYASWATLNNLPEKESELWDDPDRDGIPNGLEAFGGSNPLDSTDAVRVEFGTVNPDGEPFLSISLHRKAHTEIVDLFLGMERSEDLRSWTDNNTGSIERIFDPVTCLETFTFFSKIPISEARSQFLRLVVTQP